MMEAETNHSGASSEASQLSSEIESSLDLLQLRYSMVWEDAEILSKGLAIEKNDVVLSITRSACMKEYFCPEKDFSIILYTVTSHSLKSHLAPPPPRIASSEKKG